MLIAVDIKINQDLQYIEWYSHCNRLQLFLW